jgi:hypothetical protein
MDLPSLLSSNRPAQSSLGTLPGLFLSLFRLGCFCFLARDNVECVHENGQCRNITQGDQRPIVYFFHAIDGWEVPDPDTMTAPLATTEVLPSIWHVDTTRDPCTTVAMTVALLPATMRDTTATKMFAVYL